MLPSIRTLLATAAVLLVACTPKDTLVPPPETQSQPIIHEEAHPGRWLVQVEAPVGLTLRDGAAWNQAIARIQQTVLACAALPAEQVLRKLQAIPSIHVRASAAERARILACPGVVAVTEDRANLPMLTQSIPIIEARDAAFGGSYGAGQQVAILDTGYFASVTQLAGQIVYESDTADNDISAVVTDSFCTHGTNVAAIAAGTAGVASGAELLIFKVFSDDPAEAANVATGHLCSAAYDTDMDEALDDIALQVQGGAAVASVNLSVGTATTFSSTCVTGLASAFSTLTTAGVAIVVATGNGAVATGVSYPACDPNAIRVAATYDQAFASIAYSNCTDAPIVVDQVTCFSNGGSLVSIAAPGALITAGGYSMGGTSQATPHVAGAYASLRAASSGSSLAQLTAALVASPTLVTDTDAGLDYPRLDLQDALSRLFGAPVGVNDTATVSEAQGTTVDVLANDTDPDGAPTWVSHTVTVTVAPSHGNAIVGTNSISYNHDGSETTSDTFTYQICDPSVTCDTATVTVYAPLSTGCGYPSPLTCRTSS